MRVEKTTVLLLILACFVLYGCSPGQEVSSTPTRASEDILGTALADAEATRQATMQTLPPSPIPPSPTAVLETATPEPTATPNLLLAIADMNARVRSGPDEVYEILDFLLAGDSAEVVGRYENSGYTPPTWWFIRRIDTGKDGWVWSAVVTLSGDASGVPILEPPPPPPVEE
jgi:hypothetical protein